MNPDQYYGSRDIVFALRGATRDAICNAIRNAVDDVTWTACPITIVTSGIAANTLNVVVAAINIAVRAIPSSARQSR